MRVSGSRPFAGAGRVASAGAVAGTSAAEPARPASGAAPARSISDVANFLGIPPAELTPAVREGISRLLSEVERLREESEQKEQRIRRLEKLADEDPLAPILNRRAFVREMSRMKAYAERYGAPSSVIFFDVNGMKKINDTHGHGAGDAALLHIANVLLARIRGSDVVGRLGGDEFAVALMQSDETIATAKAAELAAAIQETPFEWSGQALHVSVSYGTVGFDGASEPADVLDRADRAMYARKRSGRS